MSEQMNADLERAMGRVRKMMALANDSAASPGERENALRMAHATLAKHNMTMAEAEAKGESEADKRDPLGVDFPGHVWARQAAYAVAKLFFCTMIVSGKKTQAKLKFIFVGRAANVQTAADMAMYVVKSIQREANAATRAGGHNGEWNRTFCKGATEVIAERCKEMRAAAEAASQEESKPGTSIVLASYYKTEMDANAKRLAELYNVRHSNSRQSTGSDRARAAGREYGATVSLNRQVTGAGSAVRRLK